MKLELFSGCRLDQVLVLAFEGSHETSHSEGLTKEYCGLASRRERLCVNGVFAADRPQALVLPTQVCRGRHPHHASFEGGVEALTLATGEGEWSCDLLSVLVSCGC